MLGTHSSFSINHFFLTPTPSSSTSTLFLLLSSFSLSAFSSSTLFFPVSLLSSSFLLLPLSSFYSSIIPSFPPLHVSPSSSIPSKSSPPTFRLTYQPDWWVSVLIPVEAPSCETREGGESASDALADHQIIGASLWIKCWLIEAVILFLFLLIAVSCHLR